MFLCTSFLLAVVTDLFNNLLIIGKIMRQLTYISSSYVSLSMQRLLHYHHLRAISSVRRTTANLFITTFLFLRNYGWQSQIYTLPRCIVTYSSSISASAFFFQVTRLWLFASTSYIYIFVGYLKATASSCHILSSFTMLPTLQVATLPVLLSVFT